MKVKLQNTLCCQKLSDQIAFAVCEKLDRKAYRMFEHQDSMYACERFNNENQEPIEVEVLDIFEIDDLKLIQFEYRYDDVVIRYWTHEFDSMGQLVFVRNHDSEPDIMNAYLDSQLDDRLL